MYSPHCFSQSKSDFATSGKMQKKKPKTVKVNFIH